MKKIKEKLQEYWIVLLTIVGVGALIRLFLSTSKKDGLVVDVSKELKKKEELKNQLKQVENLKPSEEELLQWLNKK